MAIESFLSKLTTMKRGEMVFTSWGAYSDYGIAGLYRCLATFEMQDEIRDFRKLHPTTRLMEKFIEFLEQKKLLKEVTFKEIWCGSGY